MTFLIISYIIAVPAVIVGWIVLFAIDYHHGVMSDIKVTSVLKGLFTAFCPIVNIFVAFVTWWVAIGETWKIFEKSNFANKSVIKGRRR
jgi:hypothetical protein